MPSAVFFRGLGLFIDEDFLDSETCRDTCVQMRDAEIQRSGTLAGADGHENLLNEEIRRVQAVRLDPSESGPMRAALEQLRPTLESHFGATLREMEPPAFLRYTEGCFYVPHRDGGPESSAS